MDIHQKPIVWFDIPVADMPRAVAFYNAAFGLSLAAVDFMGRPSAFFAMAGDQAGGMLLLDPGRAGLPGSVLIYLNGGDSLDAALERIRHAGGVVTRPKTIIEGGHGVFAHVQDSEGNEIGVWAMQ